MSGVRAGRAAGLTALFAVSVLIPAVWGAESWPTFRGSDRMAVSPYIGLLTEWPQDGPPLLWKGEGAGRGYSSLAIADGRIYSLGDGPSGADDKDEYLCCFDEKTGQRLWMAKTGPAWKSGKETWQSSRSTPSVDGGLVYVLTPHGVLVCCETANGTERWRKNLKEEFSGNKADSWGYSESVLIDGNHVVCTPGEDQATMVALNKETGELVWKCAREDDRGAAHTSIAIATVGSTRVYVQLTGSGPMGVRASDGKLLWTYPIPQTTAIAPTPIVRDDLVFFSAGYKRGGALLRQVPGPDGTVDIKEIYPLNPKLANKHGGVVLVGDYLYGDSDDAGVPWCADLMTGEIKWQTRGSGKGSGAICAADGHLYIHYADGKMVLAKASPEGYTEVSKFEVPGSGERPSWSHPVILGGKLFLREQNTLLCYDIRKHGN